MMLASWPARLRTSSHTSASSRPEATKPTLSTASVWLAHADVWPGTELLMPRYLTPEMTTYALALAAARKRDQRPAWLRYLNQDAVANAKANLRFLTLGT
ncbi:MAG: hypothetical protein DMF59_10095 [Acidobacteria bacterium]|nr:MAG: hypothetical protein DMF59_10095 [Acidobacteriota bacterium]